MEQDLENPEPRRPFTPAKKPAFRLFEADETTDEDRPSREWPLSRLYRKAFSPRFLRAGQVAAGTIEAYDQAMQWWVAITHDPPLDRITDDVCATFVDKLAEQKGTRSACLSRATVRKHAISINRLLAFAGPKTRDRAGRRNLHLIDEAPWIDRPPKVAPYPAGEFTLEEVRAIIANCRRRKMPKVPGVLPADWWKALIAVACYTGLRIGTLMQIEFDHIDNDGWLIVPAEIIKGQKRGLRQFLHPEARKAIEAIRTHRRLIFEWPHGRPWPANTRKRSLNRILHRMMTAAGIPAERQRYRAFHGCRKYHLTALYETAGSRRVAEAVAQASAGHTQKGTTLGYYVAGAAQDRLLATAIGCLPSLGVDMRPQAEPLALIDFFETRFAPELLASAPPRRMRSYRQAIGRLSKSLGRRAAVDELTEANCRRLLGRMAAAGRPREHIGAVRNRLLALWRYAAKLELACRPSMPKKLRIPKLTPIAPLPGELSSFVESTFLPETSRGKYPAYGLRFRCALRELNDAIERPAGLADLTDAHLQIVQAKIIARGLSLDYARRLIGRLRVLRAHLEDRAQRENREAWL
jgi:integrase